MKQIAAISTGNSHRQRQQITVLISFESKVCRGASAKSLMGLFFALAGSVRLEKILKRTLNF
jgi:hypothetical protein